MIQLTEPAAAELKNVLESNEAPRGAGIKLVPSQQGGVSFTIDKPQLGDDVVREGDRPLLIIDSAIARRLDGVVLDVANDPKKPEGARFVLRGLEGT